MLSCAVRSFTRLGARSYCSSVSQLEYEKAAENTLDRLTDYFDSFPENYKVGQEFDVTNSMGVLTISVGPPVGTYVINKQSPNKQLWLSSPMSGPKRYDLVEKRWVYSHNHETLDSLLTREFRQIFDSEQIDFSTHSH